MTGEKREKIRAFLKNQVDLADFRLKGSIYNDKGQKNPGRNVFVKLRKYINVYQGGNTSVRWLVMSGLRGVGKTTLLVQLARVVGPFDGIIRTPCLDNTS